MQATLLLVLLLSSVVVVAVIARRFEVPYPIAFVIGGSLLALVPNLPQVELDPDYVFLIFLPPLLYSGGWLTDWKVFKENIRPIALLSIGLVIVTTAAVGLTAHALIPSMPLAAAFALGAIVSPPDAVAAGAVFERFSVPPRILAILDGEGLVNDASALVIYRFAVAAALTGVFSWTGASVAFVVVSAGGILIGLVAGTLVVNAAVALRKFELSDYLIDNALQLIAPYAIYLASDAAGVSGVLAVVTAGILVSRKSHLIYESDGRIVGYAVWELLIFLLNGVVFLLIGLELRVIVREPSFVAREIWIGLAISALVIVVRMIWVYLATYGPRLIWKSITAREGMPSWRYIFVIAWSGMRGIVSLAGALALPQTFPARNTIVFVTFCVIFITLVAQGLSLIPLLKVLKIDTDEDPENVEIEIRVKALEAGIRRLQELEPEFDSTDEWEVEGRIIGEYRYRIAHLRGHLDGSLDKESIAFDHRLQQAALIGERAEITRLRDAGKIPDEIYRKVQYDLDLADERLT